MASSDPHDPDPPPGEHGGVVIYMQEGDLIILLPQHKENRVEELDALGEIVPPEGCGYL